MGCIMLVLILEDWLTGEGIIIRCPVRTFLAHIHIIIHTHRRGGGGGGGRYPQLASGSHWWPTSVRSSWMFVCKRVGYEKVRCVTKCLWDLITVIRYTAKT